MIVSAQTRISENHKYVDVKLKVAEFRENI